MIENKVAHLVPKTAKNAKNVDAMSVSVWNDTEIICICSSSRRTQQRTNKKAVELTCRARSTLELKQKIKRSVNVLWFYGAVVLLMCPR